MIDTWNRIGGFLTHFGKHTGIPPAAALAVWMVECGGLPFTRGRPVLRCEPHIFFEHWGKDNQPVFDGHFQFGGRNGIDGRRWEQHKFRLTPDAEWRRFHGDQSTEYQALALAAALAGREPACLSASFGGPQIMGFNHAPIGYETAAAMFQAFARAERWQLCGFFDFCLAKDLIAPLRNHNWLAFAAVYNGPGNAQAYAAKIAEAHAAAQELLDEAAPASTRS